MSLLVRGTNLDDEGLETVVYDAVGSESDTDEDVRVSSVQLGVVRCSQHLLEMRTGVSLVCFVPILHMRGRIIS